MSNILLKSFVLALCCLLGDVYTIKEREYMCAKKISPHPLDFKNGCCGMDLSGGNKIIGGEVPEIDQYPWAALIEYVPKNRTLVKKNLFLCGGVLISSTYVLTAAHCFTTSAELMEPKFVRLGEYNTSSDNIDCVVAAGGGLDCTDPLLIISIKKHIIHPEYMPAKSKNDIALIEIEKPAPYTDFVRPICLPTTDISISPLEHRKFVAVGWGVTNDKYDISEVKQHVLLPFVPLEQCQTRYIGTPHSPLTDNQICAGGKKNRDSCKLDSGGPLMIANENEHICELVGIVSFGPWPCGSEGTPGVYTKVFSHLPWILNVTGS
ncbi:phenoloxidase-activating enzyme-like [Aphomia sociella]